MFNEQIGGDNVKEDNILSDVDVEIDLDDESSSESESENELEKIPMID